MKKKPVVLILLLIVILSLCSCKDATEKGRVSASKSSKTINLYLARRTESTPVADHIERWEKYIKDKYNVNLELNYIHQGLDNSGTIDFDELFKMSDGRGFMIIQNHGDLNELIAKDMIMPVNFYNESMLEYKNIDYRMLDTYTDSLGNTWGLPLTQARVRADNRAYNREWLEEADIPVPVTIEEFYDYAEYVTISDPDGNGLNDTCIADYNEWNFFRRFGDVFRAFGCYPGFSLPVGYNPLSMKFEDMILTGNFIEAMTFLKSMKEQGFIVHSDEAAGEYQVASAHGTNLYENTYEKEYGFYLTGPNDKMLIEERYIEYCLVVLKHTDSPVDKLDAFYNMIYSDPNSYMDFGFGIKDEDYFDMINYYKTDYKVVPGENLNGIGIYIDLNRVDMSAKPIVNGLDEVSAEVIAARQKALGESMRANEEIKPYIGTGLSYHVTFDMFDYEVNESLGACTVYKKLISDILTDNVPIEDAIAEYAKDINIIWQEEKLQKLNNR